MSGSLILSALGFLGMSVVMLKVLKSRQQKSELHYVNPSLGAVAETPVHDDVIAVRKITPVSPDIDIKEEEVTPKITNFELPSSSIMMFLLAKQNRQIAGYELLQTLLAAGLRFGEGNLFHRHQHDNGRGPVLCSLAAATPTGVFDLQNIGAFNARGLCLFMHTCGNPTIDNDRFAIMLETAKQLSEGLDTHLLDDHRQLLNDESIARYSKLLGGDVVTCS